MFEKRFRNNYNMYSNECVYVEALPVDKNNVMVRVKTGRWSKPSEPVKMTQAELASTYFIDKQSALHAMKVILDSRMEDLKQSLAIWVSSLDKAWAEGWKERKQNLSELVRSMDFISSRLVSVKKELDNSVSENTGNNNLEGQEDGDTVQDK